MKLNIWQATVHVHKAMHQLKICWRHSKWVPINDRCVLNIEKIQLQQTKYVVMHLCDTGML